MHCCGACIANRYRAWLHKLRLLTACAWVTRFYTSRTIPALGNSYFVGVWELALQIVFSAIATEHGCNLRHTVLRQSRTWKQLHGRVYQLITLDFWMRVGIDPRSHIARVQISQSWYYHSKIFKFVGSRSIRRLSLMFGLCSHMVLIFCHRFHVQVWHSSLLVLIIGIASECWL